MIHCMLYISIVCKPFTGWGFAGWKELHFSFHIFYAHAHTHNSQFSNLKLSFKIYEQNKCPQNPDPVKHGYFEDPGPLYRFRAPSIGKSKDFGG